MNVLLCEGQNDLWFFHEVVTSILGIDQKDVETYNGLSLLINDIRATKQKDLSIVETNGCRFIVRRAIRLFRQMCSRNINLCIGIITDSHNGCFYPKLVKYYNDFINTPCKKHNICPTLEKFDQDQIIIISFKRLKDIKMFTMETPISLETQISRILKLTYPQLQNQNDIHQIIWDARQYMGNSNEDVVRGTVNLFKSERWFIDFVNNLSIRI